MSFLNASSPNLIDLLKSLDIELLWHPFLSTLSPRARDELLESLIQGERSLDILVVEGSIIRGPASTGMFDTYRGRPKKNIVSALAANAVRGPWEQALIGTCIADIDNPVEAGHIIRSFDPWLVCTVHVVGAGELTVRAVAARCLEVAEHGT
jgi:hypothetical protein